MDMAYTVLSKRKLKSFVEQKLVDGYDDPRMPTLRGLSNLGISISAVHDFVREIGASKTVTHMNWDKLLAINTSCIDSSCPRYNAVIGDSVELEMDSTSSRRPYPMLPRNKEKTKMVYDTATIRIQSDDYETILKTSEEFLLINKGKCLLVKNSESKDNCFSVKFTCDGKIKDVKNKIQWVDCKDGYTPIIIQTFYHLLSSSKYEDEKSICKPSETTKVIHGFGEYAMRDITRGTRIQIIRHGYFICSAEFPKLTFTKIGYFK